MKSYRVHVSLIFLVALFFIVYPLQTTYAYFTDQTTINGNLQLTTGTLSLAEIVANSQTFKTETEHTIGTTIQNTGSLDGKLTISTITATQNGQVINYQDYFTVQTAFGSQLIDAGVGQKLSVTLTKKKDWIKEQPIELAIAVRISQANLAEDNQGFIDEKVYKITIINDKPKVENIDWPEFKGNGYVEQRLYYGVYQGKKTTIVPGIIYLKYEGTDIKNFEAKLRENLKGTSNQKYDTPTVKYIPNKGFKVTVTYPDNLKESWNTVNSEGIQIYFQLDMPNSYEKFEFQWERTGDDTFSRVILLETEFHDNWAKIKETLNLSSNEKTTVNFLTFNSWGSFKPLDRISKLSESEQQYFKVNLKLVLSNPKAITASFTPDYTGMILKPLISGDLGSVHLVNEKTGAIIFSRKVTSNNQNGQKIVVDTQKESISTQETTQVISEDDIESISEESFSTTFSMEFSSIISENQSIEGTIESSVSEIPSESSSSTEEEASREYTPETSRTNVSAEEIETNE